MIIPARRLIGAAALGAVLVSCGSGDGNLPKHSTDKPSPRSAASAPASSPARPTRQPAPQKPAPQRPPTVAPGPGGLTPVFERAHGDTAKIVALTFDADMTADQGPRAERGEHFDNPDLIASLRRLEVPSTVFMTGRWAEEYPDQARSIGNDPLFEVANHSYSHYAFASPCYGLPALDEESMRSDVQRAFDAFHRAGVRNVAPYFRFPGGCYDDRALRALAPARVTAVQWDVVSGDPFEKDPDVVVRHVLDGVKPGSLVVMHCTRSAAPATDEAIQRIVPELRRRGYRFVKVSELIGH
ncbi:polysaccharide deacetylase family protein [Streptomyces sannanensis]|uniref:Polysaccharide deacetylase family protein n=1 Tax=Streptomyces sannanensis TaxID=285536 RepID=A0ABP6SHW9_9ACTN